MKSKRLALTEGITAGFLFGTAAIFIKFLQNLDSFSIAFWRLIIASLVLIAILVVFKKRFSFSLVRKNFASLFILSFFLGLHFIFFVSAVKDTTILNATVLVNTTPIFSILIAMLFLKIKPSNLAVIGLIISFIGVCVVAYAETATASTVFSLNLKGDLEAILAAIVEAVYLNYGMKIRSQMNIFTIMIPLYILTATIIGVLGIPVTGRILTVECELDVLLPLIGLGVMPTAIAHTLYFSSLSNLKSFETATMALLEPIGATLLGAALFGEIPVYIFIFGAILILVGILFVLIERK